ncbi:MAG: hypothetical protein JRG73_18310 [Deltaproteobacteria bacterium]|nr:hypothetical protein [Deltaproteobacteria bacterium]MBW2308880.1 hypothetical protein [Deltaproteobacteria bacterium]
MIRKVFCIFPLLILLVVFSTSPASMAQDAVGDLTIISPRVDATPTTITSRLPMVQDNSNNSEMLYLTNFGDSSASATITLYNATGERTSIDTTIDAKQVYFAFIRDISNTQGMFSLAVEAPDTVYGMIITGPADFHSLSFRDLWRGSLSTETRTMYLPMLAHYVWAAGDIYLANFAETAADVTITVYEFNGTRVLERDMSVNAHALRHIPAEELIGTGQEGIFSVLISAPGTVLGVCTVTDPDNDRGYFPLR